eukprot:m.216713 g.216713  ORF g.216713 m.216713 type:complete len:358 (-) comp13809_c3_seq2:303-1376(-)
MVATCAQLQLSVRYGVTQANKIRAKVFDPKGAITKCRIRLDPTASTEGFDGLRITFVPTCVGTYNASLIIDERIVRQTFKCEYNNEPAATLIQMVPIPIKKNKSLSQPSSSSTLQPIKAEVRRTNSWVLLFLFLSFTHALTANDLFPCCLVANCREDCDVYCTICSATKKVVVVDKLGYCKKHLQSELFSSKNMVVLKGRDIQVALKSFKKLRVARVGFISQQQGVALILAMVKNIVGPGRTLADEETLRSFAADTVTHFSEPDDLLSEAALLRSLSRVLGGEKTLKKESLRKKKKEKKTMSGEMQQQRNSASSLMTSMTSPLQRKSMVVPPPTRTNSAPSSSMFSGDTRSDGWMMY